MRVKAFSNGSVFAEAMPNHPAGLAHKILNAMLDKYAIPYETETPVETTKGTQILFAILGIVLGSIALFGIFDSRSVSLKIGGD